MLRNYTLVTDDVDLAKRSDREGVRRWEMERKGKKRRVAEAAAVMGRGVREGKEVFLASVVGRGVRPWWVFLFFFQSNTPSLFFSWVSELHEQSSLSSFFPTF